MGFCFLPVAVDDKMTTLQTDTSDLVGHKVEVYVSHFVSPTRFWCQLVRNEAELTSLSEKLSDASLEDDWEPSIGALCVIRLVTQCFHDVDFTYKMTDNL